MSRCELVPLTCCASSLGFALRFEPLDGASVGRFQLRALVCKGGRCLIQCAARLLVVLRQCVLHADQLLMKSRGILRAAPFFSRGDGFRHRLGVFCFHALDSRCVCRAQRCHLIFVQLFGLFACTICTLSFLSDSLF